MGNIINIEQNIPHIFSEVICVQCKHRWIAVRPIKTLLKHLECKNCGQGYVIETGQNVDEGRETI